MPRSLRSRVLLGSVLWTLGLIAVSHIVSGVLYFRVPQMLLIAHSTMLLIFAIGCLIGGLSQVRGGLSTLDRLRSALAAVRDGSERRIGGTYPAEVQPLVEELNALLDHRERALARAVSKAGDLAHGLKTPLAVLSKEAADAGAAGQPDLAAAIDQQVERMRRQMDYHLAQARARRPARRPAPGVSSPSRSRASRARCSGCTRTAASPSISSSPPATPRVSSVRISTRCSATSSTMRANGPRHACRYHPVSITIGSRFWSKTMAQGLRMR